MLKPNKLQGYTWALIIFSILLDTCLTANWAQTSGNIQQNVVFPAMITPVHKHWQARFGHATVIAKDVSYLSRVVVKPTNVLLLGFFVTMLTLPSPSLCSTPNLIHYLMVCIYLSVCNRYRQILP